MEGHDRTQVVRGGVLQERGLQQRQAPAPPGFLGLPEDGGGVADLQDVDLEPGKDLPLDRLGEPELCEPRPVGPVRIVGHGRDLRLLAVRAPLGPGRGEDARGGGQVEPEVSRDSGVVVDRRPRTAKITGGSVGLIHDREVEAVHPLPARQRGLQRPANLPLARRVLRVLRVLAVHQGGVRGEYDDRPVPGPQGELDRVGGGAHAQFVQDRVVLQRAHRDHGGPVAHRAPRLGGLHEQVQGRDRDEDPAVREALQGARGGRDRLAGAGR